MNAYFVHYGSGRGPFLTVSFTSKRKALKAVREAKRAGEAARFQEVTA